MAFAGYRGEDSKAGYSEESRYMVMAGLNRVSDENRSVGWGSEGRGSMWALNRSFRRGRKTRIREILFISSFIISFFKSFDSCH
jgi:hypothetical protein